MEINDRLANAFKQLRINQGFSINKISNLVYVDAKTWAKYEAGTSSPSIPEFCRIFSILGKDALKVVLDIIYPETYGTISPNSDTAVLRQAASHYFLNVASEQMVRQWNYLLFGNHGSNIEPQMQEFCMLDHLPLDYRLAVAQMIYSLFNIAASKGELLCPNNVMPDLGILSDAISISQKSVSEGKDSYTSINRRINE